jgi:hypothetical protein
LLRIPYGLDRLPRSIALDALRQHCAVVGDTPLRLNSEPAPPEAVASLTGDHPARVVASKAWLEGLCGDYAPLRRRFVAAYFEFIAQQIEAHRPELAERVKPFDGLYAPEDFLWSALRPLPRGWAPHGERLLPADFLFWDGTQVIAIEVATRDTERQMALLAAGMTAYRVEPAAFDRLGEILPAHFLNFWEGQRLPASAFRRVIPGGVLQRVSRPPGGRDTL